MTQASLIGLDPDDSGFDLLDFLFAWKDAQHSMHSGVSRPSYVVPGMQWLDTSGDPWLVKLFVSAAIGDAVMARIKPSTGAVDELRASLNLSDLADKAAARTALGVMPEREVFRSTTLVGVSALTIDLPGDVNFFELDLTGISSQSGTSGVYLRCGSAGGAADAGAADYYVNRADVLSSSSSVVPSNASASALQIFNVIPDSQARATLRGDTGGSSSRWGFSGDFRTSDASSIAAGMIFGRRLGAGRKSRLFIAADSPFGGGTIIVRGRP